MPQVLFSNLCLTLLHCCTVAVHWYKQLNRYEGESKSWSSAVKRLHWRRLYDRHRQKKFYFGVSFLFQNRFVSISIHHWVSEEAAWNVDVAVDVVVVDVIVSNVVVVIETSHDDELEKLPLPSKMVAPEIFQLTQATDQAKSWFWVPGFESTQIFKGLNMLRQELNLPLALYTTHSYTKQASSKLSSVKIEPGNGRLT